MSHYRLMMIAHISCPVYPSENSDKVKEAILKIFPDATLEYSDSIFEGSATINHFSKLIRKQKILDATRSAMFKGRRHHKVMLFLNKQVATVGKISFIDRYVILGTLTVTIVNEEMDEFIDMIAPETIKGEEPRI